MSTAPPTEAAAETALDLILRHEGGLSNDPDDRGGLTNWGISSRAYPHLDIEELTRDEARAIYRRDYLAMIRFDDLPPAVAIVVADAAVNHGIQRAAKMLQRTVGAHPDGEVGPATLCAVREHTAEDVAVEFTHARLLFYRDLARRRPEQGKFSRGWELRALRTLYAAGRCA